MFLERIPAKLNCAKFTFAEIQECSRKMWTHWNSETTWTADTAREVLRLQNMDNEQVTYLDEICQDFERFRDKFQSVVGKCQEEECFYPYIPSELSSLV